MSEKFEKSLEEANNEVLNVKSQFSERIKDMKADVGSLIDFYKKVQMLIVEDEREAEKNQVKMHEIRIIALSNELKLCQNSLDQKSMEMVEVASYFCDLDSKI